MKHSTLGTVCAGLILVASGAAQAAAISGQGTWETTLFARDLDGDNSTVEAYYDSVLDITWLADANLAASNTFGLPYDTDLGHHPDANGYYQNVIKTNGSMTWSAALHWMDAMNSSNGGQGYLGFNDWRIPTMIDIGSDGCSFAYDGGDCGYNVLTGNAATTVFSELGSLWYDTLGITAKYDTSGNVYPSGFWDEKNTGPFINFHTNSYSDNYWFDQRYMTVSSGQWSFSTYSGLQNWSYQMSYLYSWTVHDGDIGVAVSAVPVPAAAWLFSSGLIGLIGVARRKKAA